MQVFFFLDVFIYACFEIYIFLAILAFNLPGPDHSKKCWVVLTQFGSNIDKLKHWVKNVTQWLGLSIFDPKLG